MGTPARSSSSSGCASAQQRPARECLCGPDAAAAVTLLTDICACRKPDETSALLPHLLKVACRHGRTRVALLILTEATQRGETDPDLPGAISVHLKHFRGEIAAAFTFLLVAFKPKGKAALLPPAVAARIVERYSTPRGIPPRTPPRTVWYAGRLSRTRTRRLWAASAASLCSMRSTRGRYSRAAMPRSLPLLRRRR